MQAATTVPANRQPSTSAWSFISWAFFGLTVLASFGVAVYWMMFRSTSGDPQAGPLLGVVALAGMGAAWWVALLCAALGAICGLAGVLNSSHRTGSAWAAVALNGAFAAISLILLLILSP